MKVIGQLLKSEREKRNISLNEVAVATKVSMKVLQAIEEGDTANLPPKTFLRGFVRAYAQYLKLNVQEIMDQFQIEMGSTNPQKPLGGFGAEDSGTNLSASANSSSTNGGPSASENRESESSTSGGTPRAKPSKPEEMGAKQVQPTTKIGIALVAVLIIVVIVVLKRTVDKYEGEAVTAAETTTTALNAAGVTTILTGSSTDSTLTGSSLQSGTTTPIGAVTATSLSSAPTSTAVLASTTTVAATTTIATTTTSKTTSTTSSSTTTTTTTKPAAVTTTLKASTTTAKISSTVDLLGVTQTTPSLPIGSNSASASTTLPMTSQTGPSSSVTNLEKPSVPATTLAVEKPQEVIIEALDAVTIQVRIDNGKVNSVNLSPEQVHTFKAKGRIVMDVSDGGAVSVIHNGKDRGVPGVLGKSVKLRFP